MSAIKDGRCPIMLDKERHMLFSLNVLDEMQDKFGGYDKLSEALDGAGGMKNLKWLLALIVNEGKEPDEEDITEQQIGKMVHTGNLREVTQAIFAAFSLANRGTTEPEAEDESEAAEDADDDAEPADDEEGDEKNPEADKA